MSANRWKSHPFSDVVEDASGGNLKTPQSEYLPIGEFPIVDQGKELIGGYSDDASRLCQSGLPAIVFGDHTRCFKFVDFPFCMGADGVKVLRPKEDAHVKYLYYYLRQLPLTNGGYDRHFKYLKRAEVLLPPVPDQRRIAAILDQAEALRAKRRAALGLLDGLAQAVFLEMFGDPELNPKAWPRTALATLVREGDRINYGVVQPGDHLDEGIPLVRVGDLADGRVNSSGLKRIAPAIEADYKRSRLHGDEILVSCVGSIGVVALADDSVKGFNIARAVARIPLAESTNRLFLAAYLNTDFAQHYFTSELRTVAQPTLNIKQLCETMVFLPPLPLQKTFAARIAAIETLKSTHRAHLTQLDALFASLQHRAFRGEL